MNILLVEKERKTSMNILLVEKERKIFIQLPKFSHSNQQSQCNLHKFLHCSVISSVIFSVISSVVSSVTFSVLEKKRRSSIELSNNTSERRCELKANEPLNQRAWILSDNISGTSDSDGYWYYPQYPTLIIMSISICMPLPVLE